MKQKWNAGRADLEEVQISIRGYHIRLDQLADTVYALLCQLPLIDPKSVSSEFNSFINANPKTDHTHRDLIPGEEELHGAA
jgi:hypothetical protein